MPDESVTDDPAHAAAPRGMLGNPVLALFAVLCLIGSATLGLIALNGDDFAKARIPARVRLPYGSAALAASMEGGTAASSPPGGPREVSSSVALTDPALEARAYRFERTDRRTVERLAGAFGLVGEVLTDDGVSRIADRDRQLLVRVDGGGFQLLRIRATPCDGSPGQPPACGAPVPQGGFIRGGDEPATSTSTTTRRAVPMPAATRARLVATTFRQVLGSTAARVEEAPDGEGFVVTAVLEVAGQRAEGWTARARIGADGTVTAADGSIGVPRSLGAYPLAGVVRGLERLRSGMGHPVGRSSALVAADAPDTSIGPDLAGDPGVEVVEPTGPSGGVEPCGARSGGTVDCPGAPPSPPPAPPAAPVVVTGVRLGLELEPDVFGSGSFLAPVYVFATQDEGELAVAAVRDEDLIDLSPWNDHPGGTPLRPRR